MEEHKISEAGKEKAKSEAESIMEDVQKIIDMAMGDARRWAARAITAEVKLTAVVRALGEIEWHLGQVRVTQPTGDHVDDALYLASCARIKALAKED